MKKLRVYIDTSVIGGCFDPEFSVISNQLIDEIRKGKIQAIISEIVEKEIIPAPENVRDTYQKIMKTDPEILTLNKEALDLFRFYQKRRILSQRFNDDMLHIALATVAKVDVLVSWNFKHIVKFEKIRQFNAANLEMGYNQLAIYSPMEVVSDD